MSENSGNKNEVRNQEVDKCAVANRTITAICDSVLSLGSFPWSASSSSLSSISPPSSVSSDLPSSSGSFSPSGSPSLSPVENLSDSSLSSSWPLPSVSSVSSTSSGSSPQSSSIDQNSCSSSNDTGLIQNPSHSLDLSLRGLETRSSGSTSAVISIKPPSLNSTIIPQLPSSSNRGLSLHSTSGSSSSKEFSHSSDLPPTSNFQTDSQLRLLQPSNSSRDESYTLEGSYVPLSLLNVKTASAEGSCTSSTDQCPSAKSCKQPLITRIRSEPQSVKNNLNTSAPWPNLDPLNEVRCTLEDLIETLSEPIFSPQNRSNCPETAKPAPLGSLSSCSSGFVSSANSSVTKQIKSTCDPTSTTAEGSDLTDPEISDCRTTDDSDTTSHGQDSNDAEIKGLEKMAENARSDIKTFASFILKECGKRPQLDLQRLYDFKFCYSTFAEEEYKILEEKCSRFSEIEEDEMLKQKTTRLTFLQNENNRFLAQLQYAIFMLKLHLQSNKVKQIVLNIREMEEKVYATEGWQDNNNETENSSS